MNSRMAPLPVFPCLKGATEHIRMETALHYVQIAFAYLIPRRMSARTQRKGYLVIAPNATEQNRLWLPYQSMNVGISIISFVQTKYW